MISHNLCEGKKQNKKYLHRISAHKNPKGKERDNERCIRGWIV
jgi:hypothetical protein